MMTRVIVLVFILVSFPGSLESAYQAGPGPTAADGEISELRGELRTLRESFYSMEAEMLRFLVTIILLLIFGGGFTAWFAIRKELKDSLSSHLAKESTDYVREAIVPIRDSIVEAVWFSSCDRENHYGAFWQQLYEETFEKTNVHNQHLVLSAEAHKRATEASKNIREDVFKRQICIYKNNLANCLSLKAQAGIDQPGDKEKALEAITYALDRAHEYPDFYRFRETYGWVLLRFAKGNVSNLEKGKEVMEGIFSSTDIPRGWHQNRLEKYQAFLRGT